MSFDAEHPRLAEPVGDRRAGLRVARGVIGVVPVVAFAAAQIAGEIADVDRSCRSSARSRCAGAVAPVGERRVVVDADGIDRGRRPQRIERKAHFVRAGIDDMRAVFGPVGAIGDDRAAADDRLHVGGELDQRVTAG